MKHRVIFAIIGFLILMSSCSFNTNTEPSTDSTGTTSTWSQAVDTELPSSSGTVVSTGSTPTPPLPSLPWVSPSSPTPSQETEDEIVKDFDKEIEDLLKTIDADAAKK
jgi:hypothetical protein